MSAQAGVATHFQVFFDNWFVHRTLVALILLVPLTFPLAVASRAEFFGPNVIFQLLVVSYPLVLAAVFFSHLVNLSLKRKARRARYASLAASVILLGLALRNIGFLIWTQFGTIPICAGDYFTGSEDAAIISLVAVGIRLPFAALMEVLRRYSPQYYGRFTSLFFFVLYLIEFIVLVEFDSQISLMKSSCL